MAAFSSNEQRCLEREVESSNVCPTAPDSLHKTYELERCVTWIKHNKFFKVCLQFPDNCLCDSPDVALSLEHETGCQCFVVGDTSYGSCCVDEVSAEHVSADCVIHFGHACLSPTRRLPVLYVFQSKPLDDGSLLSAIEKCFPGRETKLLMIYNVAYTHAIDEVHEKLSSLYPNTVSAYPAVGNVDDGCVTCLGCRFKLMPNTALSDYKLLYIGSDDRSFSNFQIELGECDSFYYDPTECNQQIHIVPSNISKFLMKRMHLVERVKDASTLGILVGTLGVAGYLEAVDRIKLLAKKTGKKTYIIAVGRLNVAKLANFPEIDVYVLVACPENSLLDCKEYYQPIVSLLDVELACNPNREWSSKYIMDFRQLLPDGVSHIELPENCNEEDATDVSLVTGKVRNMNVQDVTIYSTEDCLEKRADMTLSISTGSQFLVSRSWQGLEQKMGETPVAIAEQGRSGVASGYVNEPSGSESVNR